MNGLIRLGSAGIKEGLYDNEALAAYLLYRLNALNQSGMAIIYPNPMTSLIDFPSPTLILLVKRALLSGTVSTGNSADR
jgi:hypothetical protein